MPLFDRVSSSPLYEIFERKGISRQENWQLQVWVLIWRDHLSALFETIFLQGRYTAWHWFLFDECYFFLKRKFSIRSREKRRYRPIYLSSTTFLQKIRFESHSRRISIFILGTINMENVNGKMFWTSI